MPTTSQPLERLIEISAKAGTWRVIEGSHKQYHCWPLNRAAASLSAMDAQNYLWAAIEEFDRRIAGVKIEGTI